ncbi:MAG: outer membrane protein assembly factor BamA [Kiloniellaceae bacterium]
MLGLARPGSAVAQSILGEGTIREIRVEGTQRIEPETVRSYMRVNPGDRFDPVRLDRSLKNLFTTGLFADVTLRREGDALIVSVVENPIINRIAFEGNRRLDDDTLSAEITLRPRVVFTRTKVQNDVQRLLEIYRRSGRYAATVEPKVIQLPQNRVDLVFEIKEGPLTKIKAINFIGNRVFSDSTLRDEITTSESAFWNILSSTDTYDPDRLTFDRELLRRFYLSEGYADFRVVSVVAELLPDREGFIVTFTVEEGERQKFGKTEISTTLPNLDPESLREHVVTEEGDWYNAEAVEDTITNLTEAVGNLGYAFVDIRPRPERDRENRLINITYEIKEGPKVFVERIDIEGNVRTLDHVIRREFRLVEGDAFNTAKLRRSRQRIQNLGFFRSVKVETEPGSTADRTVISVEVEEQSTGDLTFGAGFSTSAGVLGNVGIRERNLLGRGQDLRLSLTLSGEQSQIDLSFTEPYFLDRNLAAGFDLFRIDSSQNERSFDLKRTGGSLRGGFSWQEDVRQIVRYTLEDQVISDLDDNASLLVREEEGQVLESRVGQELTYDTRDNRFDPREGLVLRLRNDVAGVGGNVRFLKSAVGGAYHYPLSQNWTASVSGEVGNIVGLGQDTRISDRHFIGGRDCRGFQFAGVGPRDRVTGDPLGGKNFYTGTAELGFPLGLPEEFDIRGRVFTDVCSAWDLDKSNADVQDESAPRVSAGVGVTWRSPFGPIVLDFGFDLVKEEFDETELLNFSFGTQF